jgi:hypothetical protein
VWFICGGRGGVFWRRPLPPALFSTAPESVFAAGSLRAFVFLRSSIQKTEDSCGSLCGNSHYFSHFCLSAILVFGVQLTLFPTTPISRQSSAAESPAFDPAAQS